MDEVAEGEAEASPIGLSENHTLTENISLSIRQVGNSPLRAPRTIQVNYATAAKIAAGLLTRVEGVELRPGETVRFGSGIRALVKMNGELEALPPEFNKIPDFMSERRQFCLRGGVDGKQPFIREWDSSSKKEFTSTGWAKHPEFWLTLQEALDAYQSNKSMFAGIGYLNAKAEPQIIGGDIDACLDPETGELSSFAQEFLLKVRPFYYEVSLSGCGIRFFCLGALQADSLFGAGPQDLPEDMKTHILKVKPKLQEKVGPAFNAVELYESDRHLSLTGDCIGGFEAVDRTQEIAEAINLFAKRPKPADYQEALKMGFKVIKEFGIDMAEGYIPASDGYMAQWYTADECRGTIWETEGHKIKEKKQVSCPVSGAKSKRTGFPELDILEVAQKEGFVCTQSSGSQVSGYFPQLGSSTGRNVVIDIEKGVYCWMHDGINTGGDVWVLLAHLSGVSPWEEKGAGLMNDPLIKEVTTQYAIFRGYAKPDDFLPDDREADYARALILVNCLGERVRYAPHMGKWLLYNGSKWEAEEEEVLMKISSDILHEEYVSELNDAKRRGADEKVIKAKKAKVMAANSVGAVKSALVFLKGMLSTKVEEWDPNSWLLNVKNGTIDLQTGEFREHRPEDMITLMAPIEYDPSATSPKWDKHLEMFLPNENIRRQVQRDVGKALVGTVLEESLDVWYGPSGANGKSTTARAIMTLLGEYTKKAAPKLLLQTEHDRHPTEIADLVGTRIVFSIEVEEGSRLAVALVKDLTGGDIKKARFMRQDFFSFTQTFDFILIVNNQPKMGTDEALWRRIKLIPWEVQLPLEQRRPQDDVINEFMEEGPGILNWLLDGLKDWQQDPHWGAPEVMNATREWKAEEDEVENFLFDRYEKTGKDEDKILFSVLYEDYLIWCSNNQESILSKKGFSGQLRKKGLTVNRRSSLGHMVYGLKPIENVSKDAPKAQKEVVEMVLGDP